MIYGRLDRFQSYHLEQKEMAKQSEHARFFGGTNMGDLMIRAAHRGLGQMIGEYDSANAPTTDADTTAPKRGRPATKTAGTGRRGRPPGSGKRRGRPPGSGAKRGRPAKSATGKRRGRPPGSGTKAKTGAKRGRPAGSGRGPGRPAKAAAAKAPRKAAKAARKIVKKVARKASVQKAVKVPEATAE